MSRRFRERAEWWRSAVRCGRADLDVQVQPWPEIWDLCGCGTSAEKARCFFGRFENHDNKAFSQRIGIFFVAVRGGHLSLGSRR